MIWKIHEILKNHPKSRNLLRDQNHGTTRVEFESVWEENKRFYSCNNVLVWFVGRLLRSLGKKVSCCSWSEFCWTQIVQSMLVETIGHRQNMTISRMRTVFSTLELFFFGVGSADKTCFMIQSGWTECSTGWCPSSESLSWFINLITML